MNPHKIAANEAASGTQFECMHTIAMMKTKYKQKL